MTSSNGNIFQVTGPLCGEFTGPGEFPTQRPVTRSFDVFFDLRHNKPLSKQPWGWWCETLSRSLWRHRNVSHCQWTNPESYGKIDQQQLEWFNGLHFQTARNIKVILVESDTNTWPWISLNDAYTKITTIFPIIRSREFCSELCVGCIRSPGSYIKHRRADFSQVGAQRKAQSPIMKFYPTCKNTVTSNHCRQTDAPLGYMVLQMFVVTGSGLPDMHTNQHLSIGWINPSNTGFTYIQDPVSVTTLPADGLALNGARRSAVKVMTIKLNISSRFRITCVDWMTSFKIADETWRNHWALRMLMITYHRSMMTSSNGNIFRVTGHLCGEFTGPRWNPRTKASDAGLWCFLWSTAE